MASDTFQSRVQPWMMACFGQKISADRLERNHRFIEEALELAQACGCSQSEAHQLVDYVFGRPIGEKAQEVGGVMVTLAALCLAHDLDMHEAGDVELRRVWEKMDEIRAKQAAKPKHSPLPEHARQPSAPIESATKIDLTPHEIEVLEILDGRRPGEWGAWVSACLEILEGFGYCTQGPNYQITESGRVALESFVKNRSAI